MAKSLKDRCYEALQVGDIEAWSQIQAEIEPGSVIDQKGVDLSGKSFQNWNLSGLTLVNANLKSVDFTGATLGGSIFDQANLSDANLVNANAAGVHFDGATLDRVNFRNANCAFASFNHVLARNADFQECDLNNSSLIEASFIDANFRHARLSGANAKDAHFTSANLQGANLTGATLTGAEFLFANIGGATFAYASLANAKLYGVRNAPRARLLALAVLGDTAAMHPNIVTAKLKIWDILDWETIRTLGRMQLFGVSYFLMIFLMTSFYTVGQYNDHLRVAHSWAESTKDDGNIATRRIAAQVEKLPFMTIGRSSVWLLAATVILVTASGIFTLACPPEIKDFSSTEWQFAHGRALLQYRAKAWERPFVRMMCLAFYTCGAAVFLPITAYKLWVAVKYAAQFVE